MKLGLVSLGCPKNLVDSEVMLGIIKAKALEITNDPEEAEMIIVNTCGFIESAKVESINTILQMAEYKTEGCCRYLIMTGCLGQRYAEELFESMPEVDAIVGTDAFTDIGYVIDRVLAGDRFIHKKKLALQTGENVKAVPRFRTTPRHFAYLKIAEGCNNRCSYCAIPMIRGRYVSRPYEEVMEEARQLVADGVKEMIVVAQDTTVYGKDLYKKLMLPQLLKDLNALEGLEWVRVMYLYPNNFTDELIEAFATLPKVCKYIDIPLQHASDRLLKTMYRFDTRAQVETLLAKIRARIPGITIRTSFIVGFPGETEDDFAELVEFAAQQRFENAGVFTYSKEEGTPAGRMTNQIDEEVKQERYHELYALQAGICEEIHQDREGQEMTVVVENITEVEEKTREGGTRIRLEAECRSEHEAPDIDGNIFIPEAEGLQVGDFVKVRLVQGFTYEMVAERI